MIQDARSWCTGMTLRDGMGREVGGGFRLGSTCTPMADSSQCMAKPIQCCRVKETNNLKNTDTLIDGNIHCFDSGRIFISLFVCQLNK